jgi:hypothetical protein
MDGEKSDDKPATGFEPVPAGMDYFVSTGYRKLALELLADAVTEIARDPDSPEAAAERAWLEGQGDSQLSAQLCMEAVAGAKNEGGLERLYKLVREDPKVAAKLMRRAIATFDTVLDAPEDTTGEHYIAQYRSMARSH